MVPERGTAQCYHDYLPLLRNSLNFELILVSYLSLLGKERDRSKGKERKILSSIRSSVATNNDYGTYTIGNFLVFQVLINVSEKVQCR